MNRYGGDLRRVYRNFLHVVVQVKSDESVDRMNRPKSLLVKEYLFLLSNLPVVCCLLKESSGHTVSSIQISKLSFLLTCTSLVL